MFFNIFNNCIKYYSQEAKLYSYADSLSKLKNYSQLEAIIDGFSSKMILYVRFSRPLQTYLHRNVKASPFKLQQ